MKDNPFSLLEMDEWKENRNQRRLVFMKIVALSSVYLSCLLVHHIFLIFSRQSLILSKEFFDDFGGDIIYYDTLIKRPRQVFQVFFSKLDA